MKEYGGLSYREFLGDDLGENFSAGESEVLTAAVVEFESREYRDEVMEKVLADPRVSGLTEGDPLATMEQMRYGGFRTLVNA